MEEQGYIIVFANDLDPSMELTEKIRKILGSCKQAIEDSIKKKNLTQFLEALIGKIVAATAGDNSKEFREAKAKINQLDSEVQLRINTINK